MCFALICVPHIASDMCFQWPARKTDISSDMCFKVGKHISLGICVRRNTYHCDITVICLSYTYMCFIYISLCDICFQRSTYHMSLWKHISLEISVRGTHITVTSGSCVCLASWIVDQSAISISLSRTMLWTRILIFLLLPRPGSTLGIMIIS